MLTFLLLVRDGCGEENRGAEQHSAKEGLCHRGAGDGEGERGGITMGRFNIVLKHDLEAMQNLHHVVSTSPALSFRYQHYQYYQNYHGHQNRQMSQAEDSCPFTCHSKQYPK